MNEQFPHYITPASTIVKAFNMFLEDDSLSGKVAECVIDKIYLRDQHPVFLSMVHELICSLRIRIKKALCMISSPTSRLLMRGKPGTVLRSLRISDSVRVCYIYGGMLHSCISVGNLSYVGKSHPLL